jgi:hypothetical protein
MAGISEPEPEKEAEDVVVIETDGIPDTPQEAVEAVQDPFPKLPKLDGIPEQASPESRTGSSEDPCDWDLTSPYWQEDSQELLRGATCHTYRWFDGLFGREIDYPEETVNGLLTVGGEWTQYDKFDGRFRLRVRAPLPNMDRRWDLIVGRFDDQGFISDTETQDPTFYNPGVLGRRDDDSWLVGLRGRQRGASRRGWDWGAGVRLRTPPVPYLRAQYFNWYAFNERSDVRFRQTFFWRSDDGFGTTSRGDLLWGIDESDVIRWEAVGTLSEVTEGVEWYVGQTWFHLLNRQSAFSVLAFATGETDDEVELKEYGLNFIWRRPFTRDWMYISYGPSISWPRYFPEEERELSLGFGVWLEMEFGGWVYR